LIAKQKSTLQNREYFYLLGGWESNPAYTVTVVQKQTDLSIQFAWYFITRAASPLWCYPLLFCWADAH